MKVLRIILLITGVALFLALAGCGGSGNDDGPEPPVDTVAVEPPDTIYVPLRSYLLYDPIQYRLQKLECINIQVTPEDGDTLYYDNGMHANIVGTWKMLIYDNGYVMYEPPYTDFSCRSIFYTFNADSTVTVISDTTVVQAGTFKYTYIFTGFRFAVRIGENEFYHLVTDRVLRFQSVDIPMDDYSIFPPGGGMFLKIE